MEWRVCSLMGKAYEVSRDGRIRSLASRHGLRTTPRELRTFVNVSGYHECVVMLAGVRTHVLVHRAVLHAFVGAPGPGAQGNHKNGVRTDNRVANLEWCTASENVTHGYRSNGRTPTRAWLGKQGAAHHLSFAVTQITLAGDVVHTFGSIAEAGRAGFNPTCIGRVCRGTAASHKGFVWAFKNQTESTSSTT